MIKKRLYLRNMAKITVAFLAVAAMFIVAGCGDDKGTDSFIGTVWTYQNSKNIIPITGYTYTDIQFTAGGTAYFGVHSIVDGVPSISFTYWYKYTYSKDKVSITVDFKEYSGSYKGNQMKLYVNNDPATEISLSLKWRPEK